MSSDRKLKMEELGRMSIPEFKSSSKSPIVLVLDNVRSMHNLGSIFRTSDAFAIEKLYLCGITAQPPHREIEKTALGSTDSVDWIYEQDAIALIKNLKQQGYLIISIEQASNSVSLSDFIVENNAKYALIFGNEVAGVQEELIELSDYVIEIPQFGTKHSFNITISVGIVLWDFFTKKA